MQLHLATAPDGRWVATSDRRSGEIVLIDTKMLREVARLRAGQQPHDPALAATAACLYVE